MVSDNLFGGDIAYKGVVYRSSAPSNTEKPVMTVLCRADQFVRPRFGPDDQVDGRAGSPTSAWGWSRSAPGPYTDEKEDRPAEILCRGGEPAKEWT